MRACRRRVSVCFWQSKMKFRAGIITSLLMLCLSTALSQAEDNEFECTFVIYDEPLGYSCNLYFAEIEKNTTVTIIGENHVNKTDSDVTYVAFHDSIISVIPTQFFEKFPNIKSLKMDNCHLSEIKQQLFSGAEKLETLSARSNSIEKLEAESFIEVNNLKEIDLHNNDLEHVHEHAFKKLVKLETLNLAENWIEILHKDIFEDLESLLDISLIGNRIEILPEGLFRNNLKLTEIGLQQNKIKIIPTDFFNNLKNLKEVDLRFNTCINFDLAETEQTIATLIEESNKCTEANTSQAILDSCIKQLEDIEE